MGCLPRFGAIAVAVASVTVLVAGAARGLDQVRGDAAVRASPATAAAPAPPADLGAPADGARLPRKASYSIDARLDPARRTLGGREIITWRNITPSPTRELRLHLYWNAWKNTRSTWLREAGGGDITSSHIPN